MGFSRGREEDWYAQQGIHQALAGIEEPIAKVPSRDESYQVGNEHPLAGKGPLYTMNYGPYFIAMNCTEKKVFRFDLPDEFIGAKDLVSGQNCPVSNVKIAPMQTIVFYRQLCVQ